MVPGYEMCGHTSHRTAGIPAQCQLCAASPRQVPLAGTLTGDPEDEALKAPPVQAGKVRAEVELLEHLPHVVHHLPAESN